MQTRKSDQERGNTMNSNISTDVNETVSDMDLIKKRRKSNIIAFIACTLLAFVLWLAIRNATDVSETPTLPPYQDPPIDVNA